MRLNKFLAEAGLGSRRNVEELITAGCVTINGKMVTELATSVDPAKDKVYVNNKPVRVEKKVYILLNKPPGYLTTVSDERGRKTVLDLVKVDQRIFPVGRLDKNSRGLILLTNDGDLATKILHPKRKMDKIYEARINKRLTEKQLERFSNGLFIEGRKTAPAKINLIGSREAGIHTDYIYRVTLTEGRKRQIRLMFDKLGLVVLDLKRVSIGPLTLGVLRDAHWRYLRPKEIDNLIKAVR